MKGISYDHAGPDCSVLPPAVHTDVHRSSGNPDYPEEMEWRNIPTDYRKCCVLAFPLLSQWVYVS
jgi:hypothetical protein